MPSLCSKRKDEPKRWRGAVMVGGVCRKKWFPDASRESKRAALKWEEEQRGLIEAEQAAEASTGSPRLYDWAVAYLDDCQRRCAPKTYKEKRDVFDRFLATATTEDEGLSGATFSGSLLEEFGYGHAKRYLDAQCDLRSGNAANKERKNLAHAWKWGRRNVPGFPADVANPFRSVEKLPEERRPRYLPPEEDLDAVFSEAWRMGFDGPEGDLRAARVRDKGRAQDWVMLLFLLHLGARRSEAFMARWEHFNPRLGDMGLWTRKRRYGNLEEDRMPLTAALKTALLWWWEARPVKAELLFVCLDKAGYGKARHGEPFLYRQHYMEKLCERAGVRPFGFHAIRYWCGFKLYRAGFAVSLIQKVMRHTNPTTTERYLRRMGVAVEDLREALEQGMARGKVVPLRRDQKKNASGL